MKDKKAKVFISCGQRLDERKTAEKVKNILDSKGYNAYLAIEVMSLDDIVKITQELNYSDYFLFIDFYREVNKKNSIPISLFSHQELAWARLVGFKDNVMILKQDKSPLEGFLKYIQGNPELFSDKTDLIEKIEKLLVRWDPTFTRNLFVNELNIVGPINYGDHTGKYRQKVAVIKIENRRSDIAAVDAVCILDKILDSSSKEIELHDRTYLKWAGQKGYHNTILPNDFGRIAAFAIDYERSCLFLNSAQDITPRQPILDKEGTYYLHYKIFAQGFPLLRFEVELILRNEFIIGRRMLEATANII